MAQGNETKVRRVRTPLEIVLTGRVFCDWNSFTMKCPAPDQLRAGDLIIWSWSGDSKNPKSKSTSGLLRVSVWSGKGRKMLKVKRTRMHSHLKYESESERERKLSVFIAELRALANHTVVTATGGMELAPCDVQPEGEPSAA